MRWEKTDHRDGSVSFKLIPETSVEVGKMALAFGSHKPGSVHKSRGHARIEIPILTRDGQDWSDNEYSIGSPELKDGPFTRRIALGYAEEDR